MYEEVLHIQKKYNPVIPEPLIPPHPTFVITKGWCDRICPDIITDEKQSSPKPGTGPLTFGSEGQRSRLPVLSQGEFLSS